MGRLFLWLLAITVIVGLVSAFAPLRPQFQFSSVSTTTTTTRRAAGGADATALNGLDVVPANWDFVDGCFLITTTNPNNVRLEKTKQQLIKCNLWNQVTVREFIPDDDDRVRGCYTSHVAIMLEIQKKYKGKADYRVIVVEDNLEATEGMSADVISEVSEFCTREKNWDVFHLAYIMYVPGLSLQKLDSSRSKNVVQMKADANAVVGNSAYILSKSGVDQFLDYHNKNGYVEAVPNIMAQLFPQTRYAAYPMQFHRSSKIGSLVNPQLDDFRKVMFSPVLTQFWERLMVTTGLQNNQLFPGLLVALLLTAASIIVNAVSSPQSTDMINPAEVLVAFPLFVALWGATLFTTNAGFTKQAQEAIDKKKQQQQQQ